MGFSEEDPLQKGFAEVWLLPFSLVVIKVILRERIQSSIYIKKEIIDQIPPSLTLNIRNKCLLRFDEGPTPPTTPLVNHFIFFKL